MHELRFTRRDHLDKSMFEVGEVRPELILQNAHDGTRAYRIDAGLYRLVCRNGLVVADAHFARIAIRHLDVSAEKFATAAQSVANDAPRVLDAAARWQSVQLTSLTRHNASHSAAPEVSFGGETVLGECADEWLSRFNELNFAGICPGACGTITTNGGQWQRPVFRSNEIRVVVRSS